MLGATQERERERERESVYQKLGIDRKVRRISAYLATLATERPSAAATSTGIASTRSYRVFGITSVCPGESGLMSRKAYVSASS